MACGSEWRGRCVLCMIKTGATRELLHRGAEIDIESSMTMCLFPVDAVTKHHTLGGLKLGHTLSEGSKGESFLIFSNFQLLLTILGSSLWQLKSNFCFQQNVVDFPVCVSFLCLSFYKDSSHQIRAHPNPVSSF